MTTPSILAKQEDAALPHLSSPGAGIHVISELLELRRYKSVWEQLAAATGNPINDFGFGWAWAASLTRRQRLHVIAAGGSRPVALAPLVVNRGGAGLLTLLGAEMHEIQNFVYADGPAVEKLARAVVSTGRPLYLKRVATDSPIVPTLRAAYRRCGLIRIRETTGSPWIPLDESWHQPEMHLNAGRRSDLRRARRNAERIGRVEIEIVTPVPERVPELLDEAFRVEVAGWKGYERTALATDQIRADFFKRYADFTSRNGALRICFLRIEGRAIAMQIAIDNGKRFSLLRAGYDEEFSRCSPGMLLTLETIGFAARRGLLSYEFNGNVEPWTEVWTSHQRPSCSIRAYPLSLRGVLALALDGLSQLSSRCTEKAKQAHEL